MKLLSLNIGSRKLAAIKSLDKEPVLFFLHGGGREKEKEKHIYLMNGLAKKGIGSLAFDAGGVGASGGSFHLTSLASRVTEAKKLIYQLTKTPRRIALCGGSMGGYVAIKLTELIPVDTLILICPAIYDKAAYRVRFGPDFSEIIRRKNSWRKSDALKILSKYHGKLILIIPEKDNVIPPEVYRLISQAAKHCAVKKIIELRGFPHKLHKRLRGNKAERNRVVNNIARMVTLEV